MTLKICFGLTLLLLFVGCYPKSEVDKCVEAILESNCIDSGEIKRCKKELSSYLGDEYRMRCMRAQAGK